MRSIADESWTGGTGEPNFVGENPSPGSMTGKWIKFITAMRLWVRLGIAIRVKGRESRWKRSLKATDSDSAGFFAVFWHMCRMSGGGLARVDTNTFFQAIWVFQIKRLVAFSRRAKMVLCKFFRLFGGGKWNLYFAIYNREVDLHIFMIRGQKHESWLSWKWKPKRPVESFLLSLSGH